MKKFFITAMALTVIGTFCKKNEQGYVENLRVIHSLFEEQKFEESLKYMTSGTKSAVRRLSKKYPGIAEAGFGMGVLFQKGAQWHVIDEHADGDKAHIKVKYVNHPVENIKGNDATFLFIKEGGEWRLDMRREVEGFIEEMENTEKK